MESCGSLHEQKATGVRAACRGRTFLHSHALVLLAPGQLHSLSPFPLSPVGPPPPLSQSALHLPSLRDCHSYAISEAGALLPLSLFPLLLAPLSSRPSFRAHYATEFSKWSRWHLAPLSFWSQHRRQRNSANRKKKKIEAFKIRTPSLPHPAWSLLCFLCSHARCCCLCCGSWFPSLFFFLWTVAAA